MNKYIGQTSADIQPGHRLEHLLITDLTIDGRGFARYEGRVVFLDEGMLGAVVNACVTKVRKNFIEAEVTTVIKKSPCLTLPWCSHFSVCGACLWQSLSQQEVLKWKHAHVRETLARIGKVDNIPIAPVMPSPRLKEFRNKMSFAFVTGNDSLPMLGLRKRKEHAVVEVTACGMQPDVVMQILHRTRSAIKRLGLSAYCRNENKRLCGYLRYLVIHTPQFYPDGNPQILVECITGPAHQDKVCVQDYGHQKSKKMVNLDAVRQLGQELMDHFSLTGFVHGERHQPSDVAQSDRLVGVLGSDKFVERFGHLLLTVPYNAFLQTNTGAATLLFELIAQEAGLDSSQTVWDFYSGIGSIGLYLAPMARAVHGLEIQPAAVVAARANSAALGHAHCHFHQGALTRERIATLPVPDVVVVDPPRSGLESSAMEALLHIPATRLLYVSCDAGTQARDIARLASRFKPVKSLPVDMFPYTPHVENLVILEGIK